MKFLNRERTIRIAVAGNATLDAYLNGTAQVNGSTITLTSGEKSIDVGLLDGPFIPDFKHRISNGIGDVLEGMDYDLVPGGGGYNSSVALKRFAHGKMPFKVNYVDVSSPEMLVTMNLSDLDISYVFFGQRKVPINIVLGGREDKILLKGPKLPRVQLELQIYDALRQIVTSNDAVLVNSAKDESLVDAILSASDRTRTPLYFVITTSLPTDFVYDRILPSGVCIFNYDDLLALSGVNPAQHGVKDKIGIAFETLNRIRKDKTSFNQNLYVTLGKYGVYCSDGDSIWHIKLNDEHQAKVQEDVKRHSGSTTGAGDVFAALPVYYGTVIGKEISLQDIAKIASTASIKHIGYKGSLPDNAFVVTKF